MSKDRGRLPDNKKEERGPLSQVLDLVPLLTLALRLLELLLKILGAIS